MQTEKDREVFGTEEGERGKAFIKNIQVHKKSVGSVETLTHPKEVVEEFLKESHTDTLRGKALRLYSQWI